MTARDAELISRRNVVARGLGGRPALIVIDMQYLACGDRDEDILTMVKRWPDGCGHEAWTAIARQERLIRQCRAAGVPVIYSRCIPEQVQFDTFARKNTRRAEEVDPAAKKWQIVDDVAPQAGDVVLDKSFASVLAGTPLISWLIAMQIDTTILIGNSTGGCVRASAVDLTTHNFNVLVVEDCVFDRVQLSHAAALLDLWMKYCDVDDVEAALDYVENLSKPRAFV